MLFNMYKRLAGIKNKLPLIKKQTVKKIEIAKPKFANPTGRGIRNDKHGQGHWGAPRSSKTTDRKTHQGTDFEADAGQEVKAVISGTVTKIGYPYASDLSFRYIEITSDDAYRVRHFYVEPADTIRKNASIKKGQIIGQCQDLTKKYPSIKNHVHVEIKKDGELVNPESLIDIC